jgi:hypothetical protein
MIRSFAVRHAVLAVSFTFAFPLTACGGRVASSDEASAAPRGALRLVTALDGTTEFTASFSSEGWPRPLRACDSRRIGDCAWLSCEAPFEHAFADAGTVTVRQGDVAVVTTRGEHSYDAVLPRSIGEYVVSVSGGVVPAFELHLPPIERVVARGDLLPPTVDVVEADRFGEGPLVRVDRRAQVLEWPPAGTGTVDVSIANESVSLFCRADASAGRLVIPLEAIASVGPRARVSLSQTSWTWTKPEGWKIGALQDVPLLTSSGHIRRYRACFAEPGKACD